MGNKVIHVYNEAENHVEIVQYDRNKIFQRKFNNDPSRDPVTKIEKCSDRYPYIEIRMRHERSFTVHEVGFYTYSDHSWIVGKGGVRRQKEGEGLNVVDPDDRGVNYYRERGEENYMWKYCKQIKRYDWSIKPFLDQSSVISESDGMNEQYETPSHSSNDFEAEGHPKGISKCSKKELKTLKALVAAIICAHLGRRKSQIITALELPDGAKLLGTTDKKILRSFRLDYQGPDKDKITNYETERFSIQFGELTFSTIHVKKDESCDKKYLTLVQEGFLKSQELFTEKQGIWVVDGKLKTRKEMEP